MTQPMTMSSNSNCLAGFKCPICGSEGPFQIAVTTIMEVSDDGTGDYTEVSWDDESLCFCTNCDHQNSVSGFTGEKSDPLSEKPKPTHDARLTRQLDKWDIRFLKLALEVSTWSKDDTGVGCVLVEGNRVVSLGFNGPPAETSDDLTPDARRLRSLHAEINALLFAQGRHLTDAYITRPPCCQCMAALTQAGVIRVTALGQPLGQRWEESTSEAERLAADADVQYHIIDPAEIDSAAPNQSQ